MDTKRYRNIIVFNPFGIGDVLFSTPILRVLKSRFPYCRIHYVCNRRVSSMMEGSAYVDSIIVYEKDYFRDLLRRSPSCFIKELSRSVTDVRALKADLMIDLSLNSQASFVMTLLGVKKRIGFNYRKRGVFLTDAIPLEGFAEKHVVMYYLDLLRLIHIRPESACRDDMFPKISVQQSGEIWAEELLSRHGVRDSVCVGLIPGAGRSWGASARYRRWPVEHFASVADTLANKYGLTVLLFGDGHEKHLCSQIAKRMQHKCIDLGGATDIVQFLSLVKRCKFILCNEGGPLHIAVALNVPTVSIFGPVDERVYGPFASDRSKHIAVTHSIACRPCYAQFKHRKCEPLNCLNELEEEDVLRAVERVIARINNGGYEVARA